MTKRTARAQRTQAKNGAGPAPLHLVEPMLAGMTTTRHRSPMLGRRSTIVERLPSEGRPRTHREVAQSLGISCGAVGTIIPAQRRAKRCASEKSSKRSPPSLWIGIVISVC